jgi:2'-5' RNA ligase
LSTLRCFIAIDLPPELRKRIEALSERLRAQPGEAGLRWVQPSGIHLTLKFLGALPEARVPDVASVLDQAASAQAPFSVTVGGIGCFPDGRNPRVVWAGLDDPTGRLRLLHASIESGCAAIGMAPEARPFSPHLTLGRVRREAGPETAGVVRAILEAERAFHAGEMLADAVHLFRSDLRPTGAVYTRLHSAAFRGSQ